jgi:hypothetical protein
VRQAEQPGDRHALVERFPPDPEPEFDDVDVLALGIARGREPAEPVRRDRKLAPVLELDAEAISRDRS